jgi:mono/diheme cytochrome c family protein
VFISAAVLLTGCLVLLIAAFWSVTPARASHEETPAWRLVKERCSLCHYLNRQEAKFAPSLQDLFKRQTLINGKPVNDQTVSEWIAEGSANMPSFKNTLTPAQIQLIVNYLKDHPPLDQWR